MLFGIDFDHLGCSLIDFFFVCLGAAVQEICVNFLLLYLIFQNMLVMNMNNLRGSLLVHLLKWNEVTKALLTVIIYYLPYYINVCFLFSCNRKL